MLQDDKDPARLPGGGAGGGRVGLRGGSAERATTYGRGQQTMLGMAKAAKPALTFQRTQGKAATRGGSRSDGDEDYQPPGAKRGPATRRASQRAAAAKQVCCNLEALCSRSPKPDSCQLSAAKLAAVADVAMVVVVWKQRDAMAACDGQLLTPASHVPCRCRRAMRTSR